MKINDLLTESSKDLKKIKQELMKRFTVAKFKKNSIILPGKHEAEMSVKIAIEEIESDYRTHTRQQGEEYALTRLQYEVEDAEEAADDAAKGTRK